MAIRYVCDGCGKEVPARYNYLNNPIHPSGWYQRGDAEWPEIDPQHACSRECVQKMGRPVYKTQGEANATAR